MDLRLATICMILCQALISDGNQNQEANNENAKDENAEISLQDPRREVELAKEDCLPCKEEPAPLGRNIKRCALQKPICCLELKKADTDVSKRYISDSNHSPFDQVSQRIKAYTTDMLEKLNTIKKQNAIILNKGALGAKNHHLKVNGLQVATEGAKGYDLFEKPKTDSMTVPVAIIFNKGALGAKNHHPKVNDLQVATEGAKVYDLFEKPKTDSMTVPVASMTSNNKEGHKIMLPGNNLHFPIDENIENSPVKIKRQEIAYGTIPGLDQSEKMETSTIIPAGNLGRNGELHTQEYTGNPSATSSHHTNVNDPLNTDSKMYLSVNGTYDVNININNAHFYLNDETVARNGSFARVRTPNSTVPRSQTSLNNYKDEYKDETKPVPQPGDDNPNSTFLKHEDQQPNSVGTRGGAAISTASDYFQVPPDNIADSAIKDETKPEPQPRDDNPYSTLRKYEDQQPISAVTRGENESNAFQEQDYTQTAAYKVGKENDNFGKNSIDEQTDYEVDGENVERTDDDVAREDPTGTGQSAKTLPSNSENETPENWHLEFVDGQYVKTYYEPNTMRVLEELIKEQTYEQDTRPIDYQTYEQETNPLQISDRILETPSYQFDKKIMPELYENVHSYDRNHGVPLNQHISSGPSQGEMTNVPGQCGNYRLIQGVRQPRFPVIYNYPSYLQNTYSEYANFPTPQYTPSSNINNEDYPTERSAPIYYSYYYYQPVDYPPIYYS